jgi:malate dehydrogenase (oxaloacetate-decarboxylating)
MDDNGSLDYRRRYRGLIGVELKVPVRDRHVLSVVYTPGVAEPCQEIFRRPRQSFDYTCRGNTVALVTDGSRVLSLGNLGPRAALPIMEGKSVIFKSFAGVDAFPICLDTQRAEEIVQVVNMLGPTFGAVCMEDISAPRCFAIEGQLRRALNIPVMHNDQHAGAILALACLINAMRIVRKHLTDLSVVICGAGAAGIATARFLLDRGIRDLVLCDTRGALYKYRPFNMNWAKSAIARYSNPRGIQGGLDQALEGADVFIGFSARDVLTSEMVTRMAKDPVVLAFATPEPEIDLAAAKAGGARIVALSTSRKPVPNELDIAMVYPGIFRGVLDIAAREINVAMRIAAAETLADMVPSSERCEDYIIPRMLDFGIAPAIAAAVAKAAMDSGVARKTVDPQRIARETERFVYEGRFTVPPKSEKSMTLQEESLELHSRYKGVVGVKTKVPVKDHHILRLLYLPPAAAEAPRRIAADLLQVFELTCKANLVAVVTDGSAVLGLGNIGARAALPVMEGKCVLFQTFGGVEAYPICVGTQEAEDFIAVAQAIGPSFGGINLEDIAAPKCFGIEERLQKALDIPVFHDDQHGTAVVVLAGLINALKVVGKEMPRVRVVISGAGSAAMAVARMLLAAGVTEMVLCDRAGAIYEGRSQGMNPIKEQMAAVTNPGGIRGNLSQIMVNMDVFIGLSAPGVLNAEMVRSMAKDPVVFAMANPVPEIMPDEALEAGALVVASGRSDFPNQVNNCLGFPGIFRGALDVMATTINEEMKLAAARALAAAVPEKDLRPDCIIPEALNLHVPPRVAAAVAQAAMETGVARKKLPPEEIQRRTLQYLLEGGILNG